MTFANPPKKSAKTRKKGCKRVAAGEEEEEIITNTGSILYGIQPDWLVPDKHIQLPD